MGVVYIRKYIVRRLLQLIPILIGITLLSFALMQSSKTDAVDLLYQNAGNVASEEVKAEMRKELGLDKPFLVQYATWLGNILKGDMGMSYVMKKPVFTEFMKRLPNTIALTISSILVTFIVSVPLGILSAVKQNKFTDYVIRFFSFVGNSLPGFFLSLMLIYVFSLKLDLLPVMGNNGLKSLVLPTLTLAISMSAKYTRQIRATVRMYGDTMERSIGKQNIKRNNFLEGILDDLRNLKQNKIKTKLYILLFIVIILFIVALFGEYIVPNDPYAQDLSNALSPPSKEFIFGTDRYGRCLFSRVVVGAKTTMFSSLGLVIIIATFGTIVGSICGYIGGKVDEVVMRISDIFLAFPGMVFAIAVSGVLGGGIVNAVISLALISWPKFSRLARGHVLTIKNSAYIQAAKLSGCSCINN